MDLKSNTRLAVNSFPYQSDYVQPDQSYTIGDLMERHLDMSSFSNHESEAVEDPNLDSPMRYDSELTDIPTKYQDKDYFDYLQSRKSFVDAAGDPNPKNLNSNEKSTSSDSESVPVHSPAGESA